MSRTLVTEFSTERCLPELPNEILYEIFRRLPKDKLIEISRLYSRFRDVAGDKRLWKDVHIEYKPERKPNHYLGIIAFENLYSEPWPVKVIQLSGTKVNLPVSPPTDQVVEVKKLDLSLITASKATLKAILAKYQCTELCLDSNPVGVILGISPKAFSKQNALEVLSLRGINPPKNKSKWLIWLAKTLSNCKNLKSLNLGNSNDWTELEMMDLIKHLPKSLEKLFIESSYLGDSFFESLAESTPNLKELELSSANMKCPSLLKFRSLESLCVLSPYSNQEISNLCRYIEKFPALKTVYADIHRFPVSLKTKFEELRTTLGRHGIILEPVVNPYWQYRKDGNFWVISTDLSAPRTMTMPPSV